MTSRVRRALALLALLLVPSVARAQVSATLTSTTCPGTGCIQINANNFGSVIVQINDPAAGSWTAISEMSNDGLSFKALTGTSSDGSTSGSSWSSSNVFIVPGGSSAVQIRLTAYSTGTPRVTLRGSPASPPANVSASVSASNPAASATGAGVPTQGSYDAVNIGGNLTGVTGVSAGAARAFAVAIIDGSGNPITSFGGGTQYTNGAAQATPTGTVNFGWDGANVRALNTNTSGSLNVIFPTAQAVSQNGNWNITNVTGTVSLPTGASTSAKQPALGTAGASAADVLSVQGIASGTALGISAASLPLPSGAATSAKQPALGTAGVSSSDVITVQGIASMIPLFTQIRDGAGNPRAANVDSSNRLAVLADINSPGATVTDAATQATGTSAEALTASTTLAYDNIGSNYARVYLNPCDSAVVQFQSVNQTSTTQVLGLAGSGKNYYICSVNLYNSGTAQNVALIDSTTAGNACATSPEGMDGFGGSTAATGFQFGVNGGTAYGNGRGALGKTHSTNTAICVAQSGGGQLSGGFSYVIR